MRKASVRGSGYRCGRGRSWNVAPYLLELVECRGERRFQLQRLLDLIRAYIRILAIFQKTWHLMFSEIPDDSRKIFSPVLREAFKVYEYRRYAGGKKYRKSVIHI